MIATWGSGAGLNSQLSFWLPLNDLGAGAVNLVPASSRGSATSTFTRATTATTFDATGASPILVASGTARSYYDPVTHAYGGYLSEVQSTNLLLNSKIDGTNLSTQSVSVTAQAYTLSFYGTGTVTLSGTATGAKVGTGAYPTRSTFTFTPTAGSLTLTVSGTVQYAQLEAGSSATSFIPTAGTSVTRNADVLTYPLAGNISNTVGSAYCEFSKGPNGYVNSARLISSSGTSAPAAIYLAATPSVNLFDGTNTTAWALASTTTDKLASSWAGSIAIVAGNGGTSSGTFDGDLGLLTALAIGCSAGANQPCAPMKNARIWTRAMAAADLASVTA